MDKTVRLWHVSRDECLCAFKHHDFVTSIAFHPRDDRFFLAGSLDAKLRLWSIPDKSVAFWVNVADMVTAVAFTPDGKTCIAGCLNGVCLFYETEKLKLHSQLHVRSAHGRNAKGSKITGIDTITLPPGNTNGAVKLLITSNDSRVRMYNYKDRNLEIKFRGNQNNCSQIHATFSDDGRYVVCGSEDKRVYIWPTGPTEKQDHDKRPVEIFETHSAIVTCALLAPTTVRQRLAQSHDPIYDLCNPPPITLREVDSRNWSRARTESSRSIKDQAADLQPQSSDHSRKAEETSAYLARHAHPGGNIIVSADYMGQIKIFRQDCAFQKRRNELLDTVSKFSRSRLMGASGSATGRASLSSARNSMVNSNSRTPSADRIISWRNSITNGTTTNLGSSSGIETNLNFHTLQRESPPTTHTNGFTSRNTFLPTQPSTAPTSPVSSHLDLSREPARAAGSDPQATDPHGGEQESITTKCETKNNPLARDPNNVLCMQSDQNYRYWKQDSLAAMAERQPRTPSLLNPDDMNRDPMSRKESAVSRLSSESVFEGIDTGDANEDEDDDEIKCEKCGGTSFRIKIQRGQKSQEKRLTCKGCAYVI